MEAAAVAADPQPQQSLPSEARAVEIHPADWVRYPGAACQFHTWRCRQRVPRGESNLALICKVLPSNARHGGCGCSGLRPRCSWPLVPSTLGSVSSPFHAKEGFHQSGTGGRASGAQFQRKRSRAWWTAVPRPSLGCGMKRPGNADHGVPPGS